MTTALRDAIDYTTLGWIKPELDETLRKARIEIEAFADDLSDTARMAACAERLHEVQGTLRMVELYAPARIAEEMELLAPGLRGGQVGGRGGGWGTLVRGGGLLADLLERLQGGHKDVPVVLLPLLNDLRTAHGEQAVDESALFSPGMQRPLPDAFGAGMPQPAEEDAATLVARFDAALAAWPAQQAE